MSAFQVDEAMPDVWVISWRREMSLAGARSTGLSPSHPANTLSSAACGIHLVIAKKSRSSLPCSTSCIAQAPVIALVIEAMLQTVSSVIATTPPISRSPKAPE